MPVVAFDKQWIREPNLLTPRLWKPMMPVVPDRNHPLAQGLIAAWLFQDTTEINQRDTMGRYPAVYAGTADASFYTAMTDRGLAHHNRADNKNTRYTLGSISGADPLSGYPSQQLSVYAIYKRDGGYTSATPRIIDKSSSTGAANGWCLVLNSSSGGRIAITIAGAWAVVNRPADVAGVWYGLGASVLGNGSSVNVRYFQDGVYFANGNIAKSFPNVATNAAIGCWNHSTDYNLNGYLLCLYVWDRALGDAEHAILHLDPWGMFASP